MENQQFSINQKLLNYVRELLHNTYTGNVGNQLQIQQSEKELSKLSENEAFFANIICYIALNDTDISLRKAAIIQTRNFSAENILKCFILFNEKLEPSFHKMITFLSDILAEKYLELLLNFCINFSNQTIFNLNDELFIHLKTLMMAFSSLLKRIPEESKEYSVAKECFGSKLIQIIQIINQILQLNATSEFKNCSQQQILFLHYFVISFRHLFQHFEELYKFIHSFLCISLNFQIDYIYIDLDTKIVNKLFFIYSLFFENEKMQENILFDQIITCFETFRQKVPITNWPIEFLINIKSFFDSEIVFNKFHSCSEIIIKNYIFPLFSFDFFTNITSDVEFVDLYFPNTLSYNLQGFAKHIVQCSLRNDYLENIIYSFAYDQLNKSFVNGQSKDIFSIINMISYCSSILTPFQTKCLIDACKYINDHLLNLNNPLIIISVLHFLSELPPFFQNIPPSFPIYIFTGLFNQFQLQEASSQYINIIQYFSIIAYSKFIQHKACQSFNQDQAKMIYILNNTINFNECFRTENISEALVEIINDLISIDETLLHRLINIIWQLFIEESSNDVCISANYFMSLITVFEKCQQLVKSLASKIIYELIKDLFEKSKTSQKEDLYVKYLLNTFGDEIFRILELIIKFWIQSLPQDQYNSLFTQITSDLSLVFTNLITKYFNWEYLDLLIMDFVNLRDKINYQMLFKFFLSLTNTLLQRGLIPDQLYSLKAFILTFSDRPDVQVFQQEYGAYIQQIFQQSEEDEGNEEEEC